MSNVWFTSDLHFGHHSVTRWRPFSSEEEHRQVLLDNIKSRVNKRDLLWILGDSVFTDECIKDLNSINCQKHLVMGNHCAQHMRSPQPLFNCFRRVYGLHSKYGVWLSHAPLHPGTLRGKLCLHGHTHGYIVGTNDVTKEEDWLGEDPRYINLCPEHHDYSPVDLNWLRGTIEERRRYIKDEKIIDMYDRAFSSGL